MGILYTEGKVKMWFFQILLTSLVSILVLFILCKLNGQRTVAQMSLFDYVNGITIGSIAAELATNLEQWQRPLLAMILYGLITAGINKLNCKSLLARKFFNGKPTVILQNGKVDAKALSHANIDLNEFLRQCRSAGYFDLSQLRCIVLESNGTFSFLPKETERPATPKDFGLTPNEEALWYPLILDGKLLRNNLKALGREEKWLHEQLRHFALHSCGDAFLALSDGKQGFWACSFPPKDLKYKFL